MRIPVLTIAAFAGAAQAYPVIHQISGQSQESPLGEALVIVTATFDVSGISTYDEQGDTDNMVMNEFLASGAHIIGAAFNVQITTFDGSWLSEAEIALQNSDQSDGVFLTPGAGFDTDGVNQNFDSGGMMDLASMPVPLDFFLGADGILRIEFYELFDDNIDAIDATFGSASTVSVQYIVPTPGTAALLGLGGLAAARRRR